MSERDDNRWSLPRLSRRRALSLGAGAVASTVVAPPGTVLATTASPSRLRPATSAATQRRVSVADSIRPAIRPRSDWAGDLGVTGELVPEDDVRFLLVHHTASSNSYGQDEVPELIRGFYGFHTGSEKGWPDVAYNFLVDRFGGIWEARAGSAAGPVRGDATGGSQGFALLCCSIGDHSLEPMTPEATDSMVRLLAWLGETYAVDTKPGATISFTSRGSSRWAAGTDVTARTISGHRDMSTTSCPGDLAYAELSEAIPAAVTRIRLDAGESAPSSSETTTEESSTSTEPPPPSSTAPTTAPDQALSASPASSDTTGDVDPNEALAATDPPDDGRSPALIGTGVAAGVIAAGGALVSRVWRRSEPT